MPIARGTFYNQADTGPAEITMAELAAGAGLADAALEHLAERGIIKPHAKPGTTGRPGWWQTDVLAVRVYALLLAVGLDPARAAFAAKFLQTADPGVWAAGRFLIVGDTFGPVIVRGGDVGGQVARSIEPCLVHHLHDRTGLL